MEQAKPRNRRRHGIELKKIVLAECGEPGASVASVALKHGLNANLVHKWRRLAHAGDSVATAEGPALQFVPIAPLQPSAAREDIRVELRRGPSTVTVTWPVAAAAECAAWMRELLR
jgi:transposase